MLDDRVGMGSSELLEDAVRELVALGAEAVSYAVDVTETEQIRNCVAGTKARFGSVDILVNNAGIFIGEKPFFSLGPEDWRRCYEVHVEGAMNFCAAVIPHMQASGGGAIVNNASIAALAGYAGASAYAASKWGLIGLTKSLAAEFGTAKIRVNAVCPGSVETDISAGESQVFAENLSMTVEEVDAMLASASAMNRIGGVDEVAEAVAFLASPGAAFVNGVALQITGGAVAGLF